MRGIGLLALCTVVSLMGCTTVKFVQKNPYTGESWTVYQHLIGSDTVTYCPPYNNAPCRDAAFVEGAAPQQPPPAYPTAVPQ